MIINSRKIEVMKFRNVGFVVMTLLLALGVCQGQMLERRPNVLIILLDDAGYNDFGFMGSSDIATPNIDALASKGVVFNDGHTTSSVGSPSRAAILTGRYGQRWGFESSMREPYGLNTVVKTMAEVFQADGYKTVAIGKWDLGTAPEYHPNERGFDEFYGFLGGSRSYFANSKDDAATSPQSMLQHNGKHVSTKEYLTYEFGHKAEEYVAQSGSTPLFIYLAFNAVHTPMEATKADLARFKDHPRQRLAAMTYALDEAIGSVVKKLDKEGKLDNTLIFFLSDNGGAHDNESSNEPLKGGRGSKFEGGHRVPFFVVFGEKLMRGTTYDPMVSSLDIFATAIAAAGIEYDNFRESLDGVNLIPYLNGEELSEELSEVPHEALYWRKNDAKALRYGEYKLITVEGVGEALYNLADNPYEDENMAMDSTSQRDMLESLFTTWERELITPARWGEGEWEAVTTQMHRELIENLEPKTFTPEDLKE
ncbi:MAG: sulfatase-like hydrolase/transferase [Rikenellaceae bacterium]